MTHKPRTLGSERLQRYLLQSSWIRVGPGRAMGIGWSILWTFCGIVTLIAAVLASRSKRWRYAGRAAVGVLFIIGGALAHVVNLATHANYASFADPALFGWVTHAWRTVVPPNHVVLIGLLAVFEAAVGALIISGGRRTQFGYHIGPAARPPMARS